ncbi:MAG: UDP-N-acetylmuramate dehydrogenase [Chloroflexi bacterium]|nr:UDP-N-acetylmuramate dehydrogenase [Chloroflexota bacterium]
MDIQELQSRAKHNEPLSRHTTSRIGGVADLLIETRSVEDLVAVVACADAVRLPCMILGGGANVLISDCGVRGLVVLHRAKDVRFAEQPGGVRVEADAGVMLITLARDCIERGYAGLEWAISVPGTVGGAVVGNAGAHGMDVASNLYGVRVLRRGAGLEAGPEAGLEWWMSQQLQFEYRRSVLKLYAPAVRPIVVSAQFDLKSDSRVDLERRAAEFAARRKASQPPGASLGSMFKNPAGDYAGRLIEACGLKGRRVGGVMISEKHANFFVNTEGDACAADVKALIDLAQREVHDRFGVGLELEVELIGDWEGGDE